MSLYTKRPGLIRRRSTRNDFDKVISDFGKIVEMRKAGVKLRDIAAHTGIGVSTITKHTRRLGLQGQPRRTQEDIAKMIEMRRAGATFTAIAAAIGADRSAVTKHIRRAGL
ncbi:MAG: hypothetical protein PHI71_13330 [Acidiphilium sp.]|nr:hypothetical protein [Acidiphilium sp.]